MVTHLSLDKELKRGTARYTGVFLRIKGIRASGTEVRDCILIRVLFLIRRYTHAYSYNCLYFLLSICSQAHSIRWEQLTERPGLNCVWTDPFYPGKTTFLPPFLRIQGQNSEYSNMGFDAQPPGSFLPFCFSSDDRHCDFHFSFRKVGILLQLLGVLATEFCCQTFQRSQLMRGRELRMARGGIMQDNSEE